MNEKLKNLAELIPERVLDATLYDPQRNAIEYDLSDNTSQWPISPKVMSVLNQVTLTDQNSIKRYPDIYATELKNKIAKTIGDRYISNSNQIIVGCGTDDVIDCAIRALTSDGDLVLVPRPSFPMAGIFAKYNSREVEGVDLKTDGSIDVEKFLSKKAKLIYLCSPNNPTGLIIPKNEIEELVKNFDGFVILDEAYSDYAKTNCLDLLGKYLKLIITRTFSKLHCIAGLRIGFGLGNYRVINALEAVRGPYKANSLAIQVAMASLEESEFHTTVLNETITAREWFISELENLGFKPILSNANFVFIPIKSIEGIKDLFASESIAIRIFENLDVYKNGLRITIAPKEVLTKVLVILSKLDEAE